MRSVNITYKKGRRQSTGQLLNRNNSTPKRSVDDYYQRLLEKQQNRERLLSHKRQAIERMKMRTASQHRLKDPLHIIETLNIATLPIREQSSGGIEQRRQQNKSQLRMLISRKLSVGQPTLHGLNPSQPQLIDHQQQDLPKWPCLKLKCLFKPKPSNTEVKGTVLALSANFIIDEHYCWQSEEVEEQAIKHWKMLQNYSNIVWVCQKEQTAKKMVRYSKNNGLRLDAVYCIVQKRNKKMLAVNYAPIEADFGIKNRHKFGSPSSPTKDREQKKLVVIQGLLIDNYDHLTYKSFYNAVPLIKNGRSVVHYTRVDPSDGNRFGSVVKILSQSIQPRPYYLMRILRQFQSQELRDRESQCQGCSMKGFNPEERRPLEELEEMKGRLIKFFERSMSMKMSDRLQEKTNSIQFMIGDSIRRNYRIFQGLIDFETECSYHRQHQKYHSQRLSSPMSPRRSMGPSKYNNVVYLWRL